MIRFAFVALSFSEARAHEFYRVYGGCSEDKCTAIKFKFECNARNACSIRPEAFTFGSEPKYRQALAHLPDQQRLNEPRRLNVAAFHLPFSPSSANYEALLSALPASNIMPIIENEEKALPIEPLASADKLSKPESVGEVPIGDLAATRLSPAVSALTPAVSGLSLIVDGLKSQLDRLPIPQWNDPSSYPLIGPIIQGFVDGSRKRSSKEDTAPQSLLGPKGANEQIEQIEAHVQKPTSEKPTFDKPTLELAKTGQPEKKQAALSESEDQGTQAEQNERPKEAHRTDFSVSDLPAFERLPPEVAQNVRNGDAGARNIDPEISPGFFISGTVKESRDQVVKTPEGSQGEKELQGYFVDENYDPLVPKREPLTPSIENSPFLKSNPQLSIFPTLRPPPLRFQPGQVPFEDWLSRVRLPPNVRATTSGLELFRALESKSMEILLSVLRVPVAISAATSVPLLPHSAFPTQSTPLTDQLFAPFDSDNEVESSHASNPAQGSVKFNPEDFDVVEGTPLLPVNRQRFPSMVTPPLVLPELQPLALPELQPLVLPELQPAEALTLPDFPSLPTFAPLQGLPEMPQYVAFSLDELSVLPPPAPAQVLPQSPARNLSNQVAGAWRLLTTSSDPSANRPLAFGLKPVASLVQEVASSIASSDVDPLSVRGMEKQRIAEEELDEEAEETPTETATEWPSWTASDPDEDLEGILDNINDPVNLPVSEAVSDITAAVSDITSATADMLIPPLGVGAMVADITAAIYDVSAAVADLSKAISVANAEEQVLEELIDVEEMKAEGLSNERPAKRASENGVRSRSSSASKLRGVAEAGKPLTTRPGARHSESSEHRRRERSTSEILADLEESENELRDRLEEQEQNAASEASLVAEQLRARLNEMRERVTHSTLRTIERGNRIEGTHPRFDGLHALRGLAEVEASRPASRASKKRMLQQEMSSSDLLPWIPVDEVAGTLPNWLMEAVIGPYALMFQDFVRVAQDGFIRLQLIFDAVSDEPIPVSTKTVADFTDQMARAFRTSPGANEADALKSLAITVRQLPSFLPHEHADEEVEQSALGDLENGVPSHPSGLGLGELLEKRSVEGESQNLLSFLGSPALDLYDQFVRLAVGQSEHRRLSDVAEVGQGEEVHGVDESKLSDAARAFLKLSSENLPWLPMDKVVGSLPGFYIEKLAGDKHSGAIKGAADMWRKGAENLDRAAKSILNPLENLLGKGLFGSDDGDQVGDDDFNGGEQNSQRNGDGFFDSGTGKGKISPFKTSSNNGLMQGQYDNNNGYHSMGHPIGYSSRESNPFESSFNGQRQFQGVGNDQLNSPLDQFTLPSVDEIIHDIYVQQDELERSLYRAGLLPYDAGTLVSPKGFINPFDLSALHVKFAGLAPVTTNPLTNSLTNPRSLLTADLVLKELLRPELPLADLFALENYDGTLLSDGVPAEHRRLGVEDENKRLIDNFFQQTERTIEDQRRWYHEYFEFLKRTQPSTPVAPSSLASSLTPASATSATLATSSGLRPPAESVNYAQTRAAPSASAENWQGESSESRNAAVKQQLDRARSIVARHAATKGASSSKSETRKVEEVLPQQEAATHREAATQRETATQREASAASSTIMKENVTPVSAWDDLLQTVGYTGGEMIGALAQSIVPKFTADEGGQLMDKLDKAIAALKQLSGSVLESTGKANAVAQGSPVLRAIGPITKPVRILEDNLKPDDPSDVTSRQTSQSGAPAGEGSPVGQRNELAGQKEPVFPSSFLSFPLSVPPVAELPRSGKLSMEDIYKWMEKNDELLEPHLATIANHDLWSWAQWAMNRNLIARTRRSLSAVMSSTADFMKRRADQIDADEKAQALQASKEFDNQPTTKAMTHVEAERVTNFDGAEDEGQSSLGEAEEGSSSFSETTEAEITETPKKFLSFWKAMKEMVTETDPKESVADLIQYISESLVSSGPNIKYDQETEEQVLDRMKEKVPVAKPVREYPEANRWGDSRNRYQDRRGDQNQSFGNLRGNPRESREEDDGPVSFLRSFPITAF